MTMTFLHKSSLMHANVRSVERANTFRNNSSCYCSNKQKTKSTSSSSSSSSSSSKSSVLSSSSSSSSFSKNNNNNDNNNNNNKRKNFANKMKAYTANNMESEQQQQQQQAMMIGQKQSYDESNLGSATVRGTVRKQNEDRLAQTFVSKRKENNTNATDGKPSVIISVFDGHGGFAVAEWLANNLHQSIMKNMNKEKFPLEALSESCLECDEVCIAPPEGFWNSFGERGIGGAKCGSTLALAAIVDGNKLCTANVGDARVMLIRDGKPLQLSVDHIPDDENERKRIDRGNPNLRKSMVEFKNGTWRVGGVLALSRAFGDSFLKKSGKFEGIGEKNADYGSGFGLNAEPDCSFEQLTDKDTWLLCATDGLFENEVRGGGGGLTNEKIAEMLNNSANAKPQAIAKELISAAVKAGSTDDITIQLLKL